MFMTDNGAEVMTWPDGGSTPFRGEKATNWEGGYRTPFVMRWPGVIKPGTVINDICAHEDLIPTFAAAAGDPDIVEKMKKGTTLGKKKFKVHLDGYNLLPFLKGEAKESPRKEFVYWSDDGDLVAVRYMPYKAVFKAQYNKGIGVWRGEFTDLRVPLLFNLRADPFERGDESFEYETWVFQRAFVVVPMQAFVAKWLESFKEFPPRQKPASFSLDKVMNQMENLENTGKR